MALSPRDLEPVPEVFAPLGVAALALLAERSELRRYAGGQRIFAQGDEADGVYVLRGGEVRVVLMAEDRPWEIATLGPGALLGEMSLLRKERRRHAAAHAGEQGALALFIPLAAIRELRRTLPADFAAGLLEMASHVVERLDRANRKLVERLAAERGESLRRDLVVHDLRSPLAMIEGGVQSLLQREDIYGSVSARQRTALVRIGKNVAFLRLLVDSILEVERARLEPTQSRTSSLREVLTACAAPLVSLVAPERWMSAGEEPVVATLQGSRLSLPAAADLDAPLRVDPLRFAQVLLNLVGNAIRYTEGGVELRVRRDPVAVEVMDHGPGIPPEKRESIFDAFKQRELQNAKLPVGKGLGLAGVREMVASMGGSIRVVDRPDGQQGACFLIGLPGGGVP